MDEKRNVFFFFFFYQKKYQLLFPQHEQEICPLQRLAAVHNFYQKSSNLVTVRWSESDWIFWYRAHENCERLVTSVWFYGGCGAERGCQSTPSLSSWIQVSFFINIYFPSMLYMFDEWLFSWSYITAVL